MAGDSDSFSSQLPNPLLRKLLLRFLLGQRPSFLIRRPGLSGPAQPAVHIRAGCMRQVVIGQFALRQDRVDLRQTGLRTVAHGNGYGAVEMHNRGRLDADQLVVERDNLTPVGRGG